MKFRDKIKNKVKTTKQQPIKTIEVNPIHSFDESHIDIEFINCHAKTQLSEIKLIGKWKQGFGYDDKGQLRKLVLNCKWFRRTLTDINQIKNSTNSYQLNLNDIATTLQVQCIPQSPGIQYQGMPFIKLVGPIELDAETINECKQLYQSEKAAFSIVFKEINLESVEQDEVDGQVGKISVISNRKLEVYGWRGSSNDYELIYTGELYAALSNYPQVVIVDDNGKLVSLLLNDNNDFVSIEFQSSRVRDVFCLLMRKIREQRLYEITTNNQNKTSQQPIILNEVKQQQEIQSILVQEQQLQQKQVVQEHCLQEKQIQQQSQQLRLESQKQIKEQQQQKVKQYEQSDSKNQILRSQQDKNQNIQKVVRENEPNEQVKQQKVQEMPQQQISQGIQKSQENQIKPETNNDGIQAVYKAEEAVVVINQQNEPVIQIQQDKVVDQLNQAVQSSSQQPLNDKLIEQSKQQPIEQFTQSVEMTQQQQSKVKQQDGKQYVQQDQIDQTIPQQTNVNYQSSVDGRIQVENRVRGQLESRLKPQIQDKLKVQLNCKLTPIIRAKLQHELKPQLIQQLSPLLKQQLQHQLKHQLQPKIKTNLQQKIIKQLQPQIKQQLEVKIRQQLEMKIKKQLQPKVKQQLQKKLRQQLQPGIKHDLEVMIRKELHQQLQPEIRTTLKKQLSRQIKQSLREQLNPQVKQQLKVQLRQQAKQQLKHQLKAQARQQVKQQLQVEVKQQLKSQLIQQVRRQLRMKLRLELRNELKQQLRLELREQIKGELRVQVREQVRQEIIQQVRQNIRSQAREQLKPLLKSQLHQLQLQQLSHQPHITSMNIPPTKPNQQQPKVDPQQVIYYKNQHKLLTITNNQLQDRIKQMIFKISLLEHELRQYHPSEISSSKHGKQQQRGKQRWQHCKFQRHDYQHHHHHNHHQQPITTPYQQLQQQLHNARTENQHLSIRNNLILAQKQALQQQVMRYKVDLQQLQAQKKHLQKKYDSLYTELHSTTSNMATNISHSMVVNQQLGNSIKLIGQQQQSPISSPAKSKRGEFNIFKSFSSSRDETTQKQYHMNISSNRKSFTQQQHQQHQQKNQPSSSQFQKLSQAIINHYTIQQQLHTTRKHLTQLQQQNSTLRSIIHKQKKTSFPLISSTSSSKQLKLQMIQLKKLANRLTEELTEKNLVIENMRVVNKEINARLGEVTREFHVYRMGEGGGLREAGK